MKTNYGNIKEVFDGKSEEDIKRSFAILTAKQVEAVYRKNGIMLSDNNDIGSTTYSNYRAAIEKIRNFFQEEDLRDKGCSFEYYIKNTTKEELINIIAEFSDKIQSIFYKRFGEDLDTINPYMTSEELKNLNWFITKINNERSSKRGFYIFEKLPGIPKERIKMFIDTLDKEYRDVFYKRFGEDLDTFNYGLNEAENNKMVRVYDRLKAYFDNEKYYASAFEKYGVSKKCVLENKDCLSDEARKTLFKVYGENLDTYNVDEVIDFRNLKQIFKEITSDITFMENKDIYKKTIEYFNKYPAEYVYKAINKLDKKAIKEIEKVENSDISILDGLNFSITNRIAKYLESWYIEYKYNFFRDLGCSKDYANSLLQDLSDFEKEVINKTIKKEYLSKKEIRTYKHVVSKLKARIADSKKIETIYSILYDYPKEKIDKALSCLSEYDKNQIKLRYGEDLENPIKDEKYTEEEAKYIIRDILPNMRQMLKSDNLNTTAKPVITVKVNPRLFKKDAVIKKEEIKPEKTKNLLEMFGDIDENDFRLLVNILPLKYRKVLTLKHGENLDEFIYFDHNQIVKYKKIYDEAIGLLDNAVSIYKTGINSSCKIDIDEFKANMNNLTEKELNILKKIHGQDLNKTLPICILKEDERRKYNIIVDKLNRSMNNPVKVALLDNYKDMIENGVSPILLDQIIDEAISKFDSQIDMERYILKELYRYLKDSLNKDNRNR